MLKNREIPLRERNIILIGFMGVGKTTIGRLVANKLYRDFIDIDQEIETRNNMSIREMFNKLGEEKFREIEKNTIQQICTHTRLKVISLGGGAFLNEEVREICLSTSVVFFLDLSFESWKERLDLITEDRPILRNKSLEEIKELFHNRQHIYTFNNSKISTDDLNPDESADYIVNTLKLGWEIYE